MVNLHSSVSLSLNSPKQSQYFLFDKINSNFYFSSSQTLSLTQQRSLPIVRQPLILLERKQKNQSRIFQTSFQASLLNSYSLHLLALQWSLFPLPFKYSDVTENEISHPSYLTSSIRRVISGCDAIRIILYSMPLNSNSNLDAYSIPIPVQASPRSQNSISPDSSINLSSHSPLPLKTALQSHISACKLFISKYDGHHQFGIDLQQYII